MKRVPWTLLVLIAALFVPALGSRFYTFVANDVAIMGLFAVSLNVLIVRPWGLLWRPLR